MIIRRRHDARAHLALSTLMLLVRLLRLLMPTLAVYLVRMWCLLSKCGCPLSSHPYEAYRLYDGGVVYDGLRPRPQSSETTFASVNGSRTLTTGAARPCNINVYWNYSKVQTIELVQRDAADTHLITVSNSFPWSTSTRWLQTMTVFRWIHPPWMYGLLLVTMTSLIVK